MIDHRFAILGALLSYVGSAGYALDTLRGRTQPNRVSWILWALASFIAFAAELVDHVGLAALMTLAVGLGPFTVAVASFVRARGFWKLTRVDLVCGGLSLLALAMWAVTSRGTVAILFSILSDALAGVPTMTKAWRDPGSESVKAFAGGIAGGTFTLLTLSGSAWTFANYGFPGYILLFDVITTALLIAPRSWFPGRRSGRERPVGSAR